MITKEKLLTVFKIVSLNNNENNYQLGDIRKQYEENMLRSKVMRKAVRNNLNIDMKSKLKGQDIGSGLNQKTLT
jgi:hypothetical protein